LEEKTFFLRNWRSVLFIENPERKIFDKAEGRKIRKLMTDEKDKF